jgi:uncharacterized protein YndB with AHSA1/START domain
MSAIQTVIVTHSFEAAPERVFDAWLDPARMRRFLFATSTGEIVKVEADPRVGGRFLVIDRRPDMGDVEHHGRYVEIDRPRRLAFDFALSADMADATRVTLNIAPKGSGCEVVLVHDGVAQAYAERTQGGWTTILKGLAESLA